jgi:hypothetical protein
MGIEFNDEVLESVLSHSEVCATIAHSLGKLELMDFEDLGVTAGNKDRTNPRPVFIPIPFDFREEFIARLKKDLENCLKMHLRFMQIALTPED